MLFACGAGARAQSASTERVDAGVHLSWVRAEGATECGNAGLVQTDVTRRLGKNPFTEPSRVFVEAVASREGGLFQAQLEMRDEIGGSLGARKVTSDAATCDSLVSAAGLAIALMIDPEAALAPKAAPPPPVLAAPPLREVPILPVPLPRPPAARGALLVALTATARTLPRAALGVRVGGDVRLARRFDAEASLTFFPEQRQARRGFEVSFGLTYASAGLCYQLLQAATVQLAGCGFGSLGAIHATTFEPARSHDGQLLWSAAGLGLRAAWVLADPLLIRAGVEASLPLERRDYLIKRGTSENVVVFSDPAFAAALHVGLGVRF